MRSAPLIPAARTRIRISPSPDTGSGRSATSIRPLTMVAARMRHAMRVRLEGLHHVTCITGDAQANVEFYAGELGLRMVKKTVNQDDPTVYHLFYADENGSSGSDITFFEYPGAAKGRAGDGMVHLVAFRVSSEESLEFWRTRVGGTISDRALTFEDPEGLTLQLVVDDSGDEPLTSDAPDIPEEHRLRGFAGVRAYASDPSRSERLLRAVAFDDDPPWVVSGEKRGG